MSKMIKIKVLVFLVAILTVTLAVSPAQACACGANDWSMMSDKEIVSIVNGLEDETRIVAGKRGEDCKRDSRADALDRGKQPEPVPLLGRREADQADIVLRYLHLGMNEDFIADRTQLRERPGGREDQVADPLHIDNRMVGAEAVQQSPQLGNHAAWPRKRRALAR